MAMILNFVKGPIQYSGQMLCLKMKQTSCSSAFPVLGERQNPQP